MGPVPSLRRNAERVIATLASSPLLSRLTGRIADLRLPRLLLAPAIRAYARGFGVDLSEAELAPESYPSFNAFFTRRLRAGVRPIAVAGDAVVSPSDSVLSSIGCVPADGRLEQVKGESYAIEALLGSSDEAARFRAGQHATLYLSPAMYHRVHSPVDGEVVSWRYVPGRLFPVNAMGVRSVPGLFTRNERVSVRIETASHGAVAVVLVGAANVGRIGLAFTDLVANRGHAGGSFRPPAPIPIRRGDDLGVFNLGSTVVLLIADPALAPAARAGGLVRMGQPLWRRAAPGGDRGPVLT